MTENEAQRLTYISKDGLVCYKDHKSPNVISAYDIKATHSLDEACTIIDILLRRLAEHEAIGTVEELQELKEKSVAKKPFRPFGTHSYKCSNCWQFVAHEVDDNCDLETTMADYCTYCGQKLDWQ